MLSWLLDVNCRSKNVWLNKLRALTVMGLRGRWNDSPHRLSALLIIVARLKVEKKSLMSVTRYSNQL